jgi:hypothetical protein
LVFGAPDVCRANEEPFVPFRPTSVIASRVDDNRKNQDNDLGYGKAEKRAIVVVYSDLIAFLCLAVRVYGINGDALSSNKQFILLWIVRLFGFSHIYIIIREGY